MRNNVHDEYLSGGDLAELIPETTNPLSGIKSLFQILDLYWHSPESGEI
jgi:hypothetical protein